MAIAVQTGIMDDPLNTVAVVPFDLAPTTTNRNASAASTSSSSLAAAASNLISAIAQGAAAVVETDIQSDSGSEEGSSSFTYTAPASAASADEQRGWYASTPYHISNRYYDADITLRATKAALPLTHSSAGDGSTSVLSQSYPAYVVVVDRTRSLEYHRLLAAGLESKVAPGFDADISIVAGVSLFSSSNTQLVTAVDDNYGSSSRQEASQTRKSAKTSDLVALYSDHGWEFIAVDEMDEQGSDEDSSSDTSGQDDTDGFERIREALMNHMWHGLVRRDQAASSLGRNEPSIDSAAFPTPLPLSSFSDTTENRFSTDCADEQEADDRVFGGPACGPSNGSPAVGALPTLDLDNHAEASDLDEQLAKLFLASSGNPTSADFAKLEAFLESEDPSWPGLPPGPSSNAATAGEKSTFEDDFDDFLPFQSAPSSTAPSASQPTTDSDDLPSMDDISQMQSHLFGANAAARLEAGPLGMGSQPSGPDSGDADLASQLSQLQWHAQRVRDIADPDQRRKEAALVALAFSMQWSTVAEDVAGSAGAMEF